MTEDYIRAREMFIFLSAAYSYYTVLYIEQINEGTVF